MIKNNATSRIRAAIARNPDMPVKDIAKVAGTSAAYVYAVRHRDSKAFGEKNKAAILRKAYPGDPVYADSRLTLTTGAIEHIAKELGPDPVVEMFDPIPDPVNHPPHYKAGGIETIDFIEAKKLNYNLGNVVKYITRADLKGNRKQDLEKALWYLNRELSA